MRLIAIHFCRALINIYKVYTCKYFLNIHACVCIYIYKIIVHTTHTYILCKHKLLFWMRLIAINRFTALIVSGLQVYILQFRLYLSELRVYISQFRLKIPNCKKNLLNFDGFRIKYSLNMFWTAQSHVYPICNAYLMLCIGHIF